MDRILVVDDDQEIVRLLTSYFDKSGFQVMKAYDGKTALQILHQQRPDLVILDLMLPDQDGWDITKRVRNDPELADIPIIMLTARVEDSDKIVGLELGADDYITKPFNPREVVARARALLRRAQSGFSVADSDQEVYQVGRLRLDIRRRKLTCDGEDIDLTPSEFELLRVLMSNPGFVFTRDELVEKALGYSYEGLGRTLDSHIKNLRKKLENTSRGQSYIETVYGVGYKFKESTS